MEKININKHHGWAPDSHRDWTIEKCIYFIQNVFKYKGFEKAVVGVSGGLDSAVIVALCVKALGKENVFGYMLPYWEQHDIADSKLVCKTFGISSETLNIKTIVDCFPMNKDLSRVGNIKARVRMTILYDQSARVNALVVGTGNKTELMLGYFTLYGDSACALEPIGHLFKTEVRDIAKKLKVPKKIITKAPSAGLWAGQTDEEELGCSYAKIDKILALYESLRKEKGSEIAISEASKIPIPVVCGVINRVEKNEFKSKLPLVLGKI